MDALKHRMPHIFCHLTPQKCSRIFFCNTSQQKCKKMKGQQTKSAKNREHGIIDALFEEKWRKHAEIYRTKASIIDQKM